MLILICILETDPFIIYVETLLTLLACILKVIPEVLGTYIGKNDTGQ